MPGEMPGEMPGNAPGSVAAVRERSVQAPRYHFIAPEGSCRPFDPNGCLYWNRRFHVFYIFQNADLPDGGHCWGHASSPDLINWTFHPTALAAGPDDPERGIYSGCAVVSKEGRPTLVYYGLGAGICIATCADDNLLEWEKHPSNPVIPEPKRGDPHFDVYRVFDPHVWVEDDTYHAILGGWVKPHDIRDTAYLFTSDDLDNWTYQRPFYSPHPHWTDENEDCACPDFFDLGDKSVLLCISHTRGTRYYVGTRTDGTFVPESHHRMTWPGGSCFAPETLTDDMGRRIMFAWAVEQRREDSGFAVMTLPRVLSLGEGLRIKIEPAREVEILRTAARRRDAFVIDDEIVTLLEMAGDTMEIDIEFQPQSARRLGLIVRAAPNGVEQTRIVYDAGAGTLSVDTAHSSLADDVFRQYPIVPRGAPVKDIDVQTAPLELYPDDPLKLRVFLDRSILEVFANDYLCLTQRIYPTLAGSIYTRLFADGGTAEVTRIQA